MNEVRRRTRRGGRKKGRRATAILCIGARWQTRFFRRPPVIYSKQSREWQRENRGFSAVATRGGSDRKRGERGWARGVLAVTTHPRRKGAETIVQSKTWRDTSPRCVTIATLNRASTHNPLPPSSFVQQSSITGHCRCIFAD